MIAHDDDPETLVNARRARLLPAEETHLPPRVIAVRLLDGEDNYDKRHD